MQNGLQPLLLSAGPALGPTRALGCIPELPLAPCVWRLTHPPPQHLQSFARSKCCFRGFLPSAQKEAPGESDCTAAPSSASPERTWLPQGSPQDWSPHSFGGDTTPHFPATIKALRQRHAEHSEFTLGLSVPTLGRTFAPLCISSGRQAHRLLCSGAPRDKVGHHPLPQPGSPAIWGTGAHRWI